MLCTAIAQVYTKRHNCAHALYIAQCTLLFSKLEKMHGLQRKIQQKSPVSEDSSLWWGALCSYILKLQKTHSGEKSNKVQLCLKTAACGGFFYISLSPLKIVEKACHLCLKTATCGGEVKQAAAAASNCPLILLLLLYWKLKFKKRKLKLKLKRPPIARS